MRSLPAELTKSGFSMRLVPVVFSPNYFRSILINVGVKQELDSAYWFHIVDFSQFQSLLTPSHNMHSDMQVSVPALIDFAGQHRG